jgi:hypothetical protein
MAPSGPLNEETARQVIQIWLSSKADAFGSEHNVDKLQQILVNPALSRWQRNAQTVKNSNSYRKYQHKVEVTSVQTRDTNPDQASVDAQVNEAVDSYRAGEQNKVNSSDESLRVRYDLVRRDGQWLIKDMTVLK